MTWEIGGAASFDPILFSNLANPANLAAYKCLKMFA